MKGPNAIAAAQAKLTQWSDGGAAKTLLHGFAGAPIAALGGSNAAMGGALGAAVSEKVKGAMITYLISNGVKYGSGLYQALTNLGSAALGATSDERWAANVKYLDRMISKGDEVVFSNPANRAVPGTSFYREVKYLRCSVLVFSSHFQVEDLAFLDCATANPNGVSLPRLRCGRSWL